MCYFLQGVLCEVVSLALSSALTWIYQRQYIVSVLCCWSYVNFFLLTYVCQFSFKPEPILTET